MLVESSQNNNNINLKLCNTLDYWSRNMLNFDFLEKDLGIVSPPYFMYDFSQKLFLMLNSISWSNFIAWLPLLLEIMVNMCITIVCLLTSLRRHRFWNLLYLSNKVVYRHGQILKAKSKHLENEKSTQGEIKSIFHHFKRAFI